MMDRIEDETVRYLFFLQVNTGTGPVLPFPEEDEEEERSRRKLRVPTRPSSSGWPPKPRWRTSRATSSARRSGRWRQLQFVGGDGSTGADSR